MGHTSPLFITNFIAVSQSLSMSSTSSKLSRLFLQCMCPSSPKELIIASHSRIARQKQYERICSLAALPSDRDSTGRSMG
jgi:hypothetical protein